MLRTIKNGQTSVVLRVKILDSSVSTGAGLTGLTSASAGLIIGTIALNEATSTAYTQAGGTIETITTIGTYAAPTATKCRFKEVDAVNHKGIYELQFADARFAVANALVLFVSLTGATNMAQADFVVQLQADDPNVAKPANFSLMSIDGSGRTDVIKVAGTTQTARDLGAQLDAAVSTRMATYAQPTGFLAATFPASVASPTNITAVGSVTGAVGSVTGLTAANLDVAVSTRMATYAQPTGFLAAAFPGTVASPTNITAGVITTVTNVTNAPTVGDLTAAMRASVNAEADTAVADAALATAANLAVVASYIDTEIADIRARLPAALVGGRMDSSVGAMAADVITAAATAADFSTEIQTGLATTAAVSTLQTGVTAIKAKTDNLPAAPAAVSDIPTVVAIQTGLATTSGLNAIKLVTDKLNTLLETAAGSPGDFRISVDAMRTVIDEIGAAVWEELVVGHLTAGTTGAALEAASLGSDPWTASLPGAYGAGTAGKIVGDNINAAISTRMATYVQPAGFLAATFPSDPADQSIIIAATDAVMARLGAPAGASMSADTAAIKAKTDNLPAAPAAVSDIPTAAAIVDAVWDESATAHVAVGSTGAALEIAGTAGDPWNALLPGTYGAGTAGKIIGDNVDALISTRATQASVDAVPTNAELATALAAADDPVLAAVAAISISTSAAAIADAVWDESAAAHVTAGSTGQALGATGAIGDPWITPLPGAYAAGSAGNIVGTFLDTEVSSRATQTSVDSIPIALDVASAVWEEAKSTHVTVGSMGAALNDTDNRGARTMLRGVAASGATNTAFAVSSLDAAGASIDQFKGRIILFDKATTTPELRGQGTLIQSNTADALPTFTVVALTVAPAAGDVFSMV